MRAGDTAVGAALACTLVHLRLELPIAAAGWAAATTKPELVVSSCNGQVGEPGAKLLGTVAGDRVDV
jgi:hypothetical protein